jgi:hypothetical protein
MVLSSRKYFMKNITSNMSPAASNIEENLTLTVIKHNWEPYQHSKQSLALRHRIETWKENMPQMQ